MTLKSRRFPDTPWSLVRRGASGHDDIEQREALDALLRLYLPALRAFVSGAFRLAPEDCEDIVNGFVADKVLHKGLLAHADPRRGRLRNLMCKSLGNYVTTWLNKETSRRRRMPDAGAAALQQLMTTSVSEDFDRFWAEGLVHDAIAIMQQDCAANGRPDLFDIFTARISGPLLEGALPESYESLTERLQLRSPRRAINLLATAKRAYVRALKQAAGRYVSNNTEVDAELADLRAALDPTPVAHATSAARPSSNA